MTRHAREAYGQRLMAVLEGDAAAVVVTETGELEALPIEIPPDFRLWVPLTRADRKDRAALRALRADVLRDAPTCGFAVMQEYDPLECLALLNSPAFDRRLQGIPWRNALPEQVRAWVSRLRRIQGRAMGRWISRGRGITDGTVISLCRMWTLTILLGKEDH